MKEKLRNWLLLIGLPAGWLVILAASQMTPSPQQTDCRVGHILDARQGFRPDGAPTVLFEGYMHGPVGPVVDVKIMIPVWPDMLMCTKAPPQDNGEAWEVLR